jgi:hypothetical protein
MKLIILLTMFFLTGCNGGSDDSIDPISPESTRRLDWMSRETWEHPIIDDCQPLRDGQTSLSDIHEIRYWISENIAYECDEVGYWQSTHETLALGAGDCEDMAILFYSTMLAYGYPEEQVAIYAVRQSCPGGGSTKHALIGILEEGYTDDAVFNGDGIRLIDISLVRNSQMTRTILFAFDKDGLWKF